MNDTINQLIKRTSLRKFSNEEITKEEKKLILEGAVNAPSAGNMQLYSIIDVVDQTKKDKLAVLCDNQPMIKDAKMVWIFLADYQKWFNGFKYLDLEPRHPGMGDILLCCADACIAAQNAVIAAESLGIGSCYIGDILENYEEITKLLNLPELTFPACMLIFGKEHETQNNRVKPKRVDNKYVLFQNEYRVLSENETEDMFKYKAKINTYKDYMRNFMNFKNNSDFSKEMSRSAELYVKRFKGEE